MRTVEKAIFDTLYELLSDSIGNVFDYLPDAETKYPFIHLQPTNSERATNQDFFGEALITVNAWGTFRQRKKLDNMALAINNSLHKITGGYGYKFRLVDYSIQYIQENSTGTPLLHDAHVARFRYNKE